MSRGGLGTIQQLPASGRWRARLPARLGKVTVGTFDAESAARGAAEGAAGQAHARPADHGPDHAPLRLAWSVPSVAGAISAPVADTSSRCRRSTGKAANGPLVVQCGRRLLQLVAAGQDIPVELITQVAATALLQLPGQAGLASRALSGEPHALRAAIELAGMLEDATQAGDQAPGRAKGRL